MWETWVLSLGWEGPLEEGMASHSSILAWRIPWTEEPGGLQSMGSQRVGYDWVAKQSTTIESLECQPHQWQSCWFEHYISLNTVLVLVMFWEFKPLNSYMGTGKAKGFRLLCFFIYALETWWRTQKINRGSCFRKPGVLDPRTKPLVTRIWVLLHENLAVASSILGMLGQYVV